MKGTVITRLAGRYLEALRRYLALGSQECLQSARELGSQALAINLGTLDLAKMHDQALASLLPSGGSDISSEKSLG